MAYVDMIEQHLFAPNPSTRRDTIPSSSRWSPPHEGTMLINVDAAIFTLSRRMGIGVVIRDHTGACLAACSELQNEVVMPELAEALALRLAVALSGEEGLNKAMVVSDCLSLVLRPLSGEEGLNKAMVVSDCLSLVLRPLSGEEGLNKAMVVSDCLSLVLRPSD